MDQAIERRWRESYLLKTLGLRPETSRAYGFGIRRVEFWTGKDIDELELSDWQAYLGEASDRPSTKRVVLAAGKRYEAFAVTVLGRKPSRVSYLRGPKNRPRRTGGLPREHAQAILDACETPRDLRLCLGFFVGTRIKESREQPGEEELGIIEWQPDRLIIFGKGGKDREVPKHPLIAQFEDMIRSDDATAGQLEYRCSVLRRKVGFYFRAHDCRKTFSRELEDADVHPHVVGDLLGHADTVTTLYSGVSWRKKVAAVSRVPFVIVPRVWRTH